MKMNLLFAAMLTCFSLIVDAQNSISGKVIDSISQEPLQGASVFLQNTTIGTNTNRQGEFSIQLPAGGYDLIISYSGYKPNIIRVTGSEINHFEIGMLKEEKSMEEVVIRSSNEVADGWEKYGSFFIEHFIGTTTFAAQCRLENPEVLKFYLHKRSNKLKVLSEEPLQITNNALGYQITYLLDSFVYYYQTEINSYSGFVLYAEIEGTEQQLKTRRNNRLNAYYGSRLHFMRSYYDSTLVEDGFVIDLLDEKDDTKFRKISSPYDSLYYGAIDSTMDVEIYFPRKISVTYLKKRPDAEYLKKMGLPKKVATQISYLDIYDVIAIKENGFYYEQKSLVAQGYWSWKNLADQLPYDFSPF